VSESSSSALESLSAGSLTVINSLQESGEDVQLIRNVHTVVDTGQLQLMHASCCSAEVQTDFEPMWCLQNAPVLLETKSEETTVKSALLPLEGSTMIDLRKCDEFSLVHLEDMRDPSSQFVMLQTGNTNEVAAGNAVTVPLSAGNLCTESESVPELQASVPVEIVGAPAMFVGGSGRHWKRELELSTEAEGLRQAADVDSGIWDMMQALGSSADDSGRSELFNMNLKQQSYSEAQSNPSLSALTIQPNLQGVYKMFQIADGSGNTETSIQDEEVGNKSSYSQDRSSTHQISVGGLEDALEPVAVVDFIVHRVEAETVQLERVDSLDPKTTGGQSRQRRRSQSKTERTTAQSELLVDSVNHNADYSDGSYEDDESAFRLNVATAVTARSDHLAVRTADSATNTPRMKKKHKDVVRVTSTRFGRSVRRRVSAKGRGSWKDPNCEARRSMSADVSRCSSMLDIDGECQEMARSSDAFSDPSPVHTECKDMKTADQSVLSSSQPYTSSPYGWRHHGSAGVDSHEWFADGSSSMASGSMAANLGLLAEPDLLNFERFPNWMRDLPEALLHVPLSDICIPGKIFMCFTWSFFSLCQGATATTTTPVSSLFSRTAWIIWHQKGRTTLDFNEARDDGVAMTSDGRMLIICTSLQTDNHTSTTTLIFFTGQMLFLLPNQQCPSVMSR